MNLLALFRRSYWLALPVLLALLVRLALAPGWMPAMDAQGDITVRICSGAGMMPETVTIDLGQKDTLPGDKDDTPCPMGAMATPPLLAAAPVLPELLAPLTHPALAAPALGFAPGIASPLPPSTGPPAFA